MKIGSKVLCINDTRPDLSDIDLVPNWIRKNDIYIIRDSGYDKILKRNWVLLKEIVNPKIFVSDYGAWIEPGFDSKRFVEIEDLYNSDMQEDAILESELMVA